MAISQFPPAAGGIPTGDTAGRPANPVIGDVYYNGQLGILEIFDGSTFLACSAPPVAPTIATPTDASTGDAYTSTAGKLSVVFTPGQGGGLINQFNAFTTAGGHSAFSSGTTVTITGLTPGTSYTVYGNAQNNFGTSVNTDNATAVTPTTLPQVPTIGTATASTSTSEVTVTWTLGNNGGKNLSAITITPFLNGTTAETARTAATTSSTSYTFTSGQLTVGSAYTFKVKATNANGTSADSTATNSVTVPFFFNADFLVIAGGGSGGDSPDNAAGGGGAGGYRTSFSTSGGGASAESKITVGIGTNYTVTVGAGAAAPTDAKGTNGSNSVFSTITSTGGGGGAIQNQPGGLNGGSGGGGAYDLGAGGTGTANQGYAGGSNTGPGGAGSGSGGGGAGGAGVNASQSTNISSKGGLGVASSITGTSVTRASGGCGDGYTTSTTAEPGGGGDTGAAGAANTGGGGGGGCFATGGGAAQHGAAGGSGLVILRYPDTRTITVGAGLTAGVTNQAVGSNEKYTTLTAGSGNVSWS